MEYLNSRRWSASALGAFIMKSDFLKTALLGLVALACIGAAIFLHPRPLERIREFKPYFLGIALALLPFFLVHSLVWLHWLTTKVARAHEMEFLITFTASALLSTGIGSGIIGRYRVRTASTLIRILIPPIAVLPLLSFQNTSEVGAAFGMIFIGAEFLAGALGGLVGWGMGGYGKHLNDGTRSA